jgi:hypothetical protein
MPPRAAASIDFLQAGDLGVDFVQNRGDAARVIAAIDADASMNVVGYDSNRVILGGSERMAPIGGSAMALCMAWPVSIQK